MTSSVHVRFHPDPHPAQAGVPLVETTRGGIVESVHLGVLALSEADGTPTWSAGDPSLVTFPRSALKPFQLLALVARGGVDRFGFTSDEIAVMVGSHGGEAMHVERVQQILNKIDAPAAALACGAQTPLDARAAAELARTGTAPAAVHNNCSGKHAGMLALARLLDASLEQYIDPEHQAQRAIRDALMDALEIDAAELVTGIDGCSAPAYALPMSKMARGFARLANPSRAPAGWDKPLHTISSAMRAFPELVGASRGRLDTELMQLGQGLVAKSGAEGFFCVGHQQGAGLAIKILDGDGGGRARTLATVMAARGVGWISDAHLAGPLSAFGPKLPIHNLAGLQTGEVRPSAGLLGEQNDQDWA